MTASLLIVSLLTAGVASAPPFLTTTTTSTTSTTTSTTSTSTSTITTSTSTTISTTASTTTFEDFTTIAINNGEKQAETWEEHIENNDLEETEAYDATIELHAMIDNELYLLQENSPTETIEADNEMTTTKNLQDENYVENNEESQDTENDLMNTSTFATTIQETEVTETLESTTSSYTAAVDDIKNLNITESTEKDPIIEANERNSLISELGNIDFTQTDLEKLELTPRQRLAISQELEYQQLGLPVFTDPTPWQRLSRDQQEQFNKKYLALSPELQEFSRAQFLSLSERGQRHAYNAFLSLDSSTLAQVIEEEMKKIKAGLVRQDQITNDLKEEYRSSNDGVVQIKNLKFDDVEERTDKKQSIVRKYDTRRHRQPHFKVKPLKQRQKSGVTHSTNKAQELHLKYARLQLQQAIHLQACLSHPATCTRLNIN